jgi:ubiquinone biosynthesis protein
VAKRPILLRIRHWNSFKDADKEEAAVGIYSTLKTMGPFYQKIGQIAGSMDYLLPEQICQQLKRFQEENWVDIIVPSEVAKIIDGNPNRPLIRDIDPKPIASGTVAQVHVGHTVGGKKIAIKLAKKNIRIKFESNLRQIELIYLFATFLGMDVEYFYHQIRLIASYIVSQTDLTTEFDMIETFARNNRYALERGIVRTPTLVGESHPNVMLMEFIEGRSFTQVDFARVDRGRRELIIDEIFKIFIDSAINDGIFHLDLHPGNLICGQDGLVYLIDFGLMARSDLKTKASQSEFVALYSESTIDYDKLANKEIGMTYLVKSEDVDTAKYQNFHQEVKRYLRQLVDGDRIDLFSHLRLRRQTSNKFGYRLQLNKNSLSAATLCLESTVKSIDDQYQFCSRLFSKNRRI